MKHRAQILFECYRTGEWEREFVRKLSFLLDNFQSIIISVFII